MISGIFTIPSQGSAAASPALGGAAGARTSQFVAGPENLLAAEGLRPYFDRSSDTSYSPLVLYGPHGSGKSHLMHALAAAWQRDYPQAKIICQSAAAFAQDYAAAVADDTVDAWRQQVRSSDLLLIEDIGRLASKQAAQQELASTLDAMADREALVVISARTLPTHWTTLLASLRSRISAGLVVPLALPRPATRRAILEQVSTQRGVALPPAVVRKLADRVDGSVNDLIAAVLEFAFRADNAAEVPDAGSLDQHLEERATDGPSLRTIATRTAKHFGLKLTDLKCASRQKQFVAARSLAMYLARQLTTTSYEQIGRFFGGRDHTTVIHGCRRTEELLSRDATTRQAVADLKGLLAE